MVDTNCDPTEVDYVIPGNDDALRAIRLFASKIADSVVEGSQAVTDKQMADISAGVQYSEAAEAAAATPEGDEGVAAATSTIDDSEEVSVVGRFAGRVDGALKIPAPNRLRLTSGSMARALIERGRFFSSRSSLFAFRSSPEGPVGDNEEPGFL